MKSYFNTGTQWGIVVPDIEEAMQHWIKVFNVGPFLHIKKIRRHEHDAIYKGQATDVQITVAFSYFGETQLEIIQQLNDSPSPYRDFLAEGRTGIQHIGFWSDKYDDAYQRLLSDGFTPEYRARMQGVARETVYFRDPGCVGAMVELSLATPRKSRLFGAMAELVKEWDGHDPIRKYDTMDNLAQELGMDTWTTA
jgi:catechol 2,3-dioxygenase-like lactoylglutathione lyase family enzyme